jgi:hypothetical protein
MAVTGLKFLVLLHLLEDEGAPVGAEDLALVRVVVHALRALLGVSQEGWPSLLFACLLWTVVVAQGLRSRWVSPRGVASTSLVRTKQQSPFCFCRPLRPVRWPRVMVHKIVEAAVGQSRAVQNWTQAAS